MELRAQHREAMQDVILQCNIECQPIWYLYLLHVLWKKACYGHFCFTCILLQGIYFQLPENLKAPTEDKIFTEQFLDLGKMNTKWFFFFSTFDCYIFNDITQGLFRKDSYLGESDNITEVAMQLNLLFTFYQPAPFHCTEVKKIETQNQ